MFAKPIASLSSGLLARKGQARPAMRPQGFAGYGQPAPAPDHADDLGWNDMGEQPAPAPEPESAPPAAAVPAELPPVLVERAALSEDVARLADAPAPADPAPTSDAASVAPQIVERIVRETARSGKAAFTLRLPADRHLRLRLAAAVRHRSAQALVTDALDAFLATLPEVESLARQCAVPDRAPSHRPPPHRLGKRA